MTGARLRPFARVQAIASCEGRTPFSSARLRSASTRVAFRLRFSSVKRGRWARKSLLAVGMVPVRRPRERTPYSGAQQETLADQHPIRRLATPDDVARAAVFLASEAAAWIGGVVLDVAGGSVLA